MLPDDSTEAKVGVRELQGYMGEDGVSGSKEGDSAVEGIGTWAHVVFSPDEGLSFAVVSDSVLNEARVGFLSHPKTMCRAAPTVVSLPSVRPAPSASPCLVLSAALQAFTGFLHQISYTYDLSTGRFCDQVPRAVPCGCPPQVIVVKRAKERARECLSENSYSSEKKPTNPLDYYLLRKSIFPEYQK